MSFKTNLDDDMVNVILNSNEFAETIIYVKKNGTELSIKAIVERNRLDTGGEDEGRVLTKEIEVMFANHPTNGVDSINVGFDLIRLPEYLGAGSIDWRIVEILKHDEAMWHVRCAK